MSRSTTWGALPLVLLCLGFAGGKDLSYNQRQAVERQSRNLEEAQRKLDDLLEKYAKEAKELEGMIVPPSLYQGYLSEADSIATKCTAIESDLAKSDCPSDHPDVKPLHDWVATGRAKVETFKGELGPKLAEAERVADPANYPDLDADFARLDEIADTYRVNDFRWMDPDALENVVREFPNVTTFFSETFAKYKPLIVVTGGKESSLYKKYKWASQPLNEFSPKANEFFQAAQAEYPQHLDKAVEMAAKAANEKKPLFFTGGVRQEMEEAERLVKLSCALLPADDERRAEMWGKVDAVKADLARTEEQLKDLILAEARLPDEQYSGGDKDELRERVLAAWKKKYPKDEILGTRFHMKAFDRNVKWTWQGAESSWYKTDMSVLAVLVVVKTSDAVATTYPAYVNVDHIDDTSSIGVDTKGDAYVHREVLIENL